MGKLSSIFQRSIVFNPADLLLLSLRVDELDCFMIRWLYLPTMQLWGVVINICE